MGRQREQYGWRIGVDLGGTWIRVTALDDRGRRRQLSRTSPGPEGLAPFLKALCSRWGLGRGRVDALVVASRGVWTAAERRRQSRRLRSLARNILVISDVEAAYLGALGDRAGVLLLAGTGSIALARDARGRWARAGGWGPFLGDEGSAFWIGREWLRAIAGAGTGTAARRLLRAPDPVARIAALAPSVLRRARRGARAARAIVGGAQSALAELVVHAAGQLRLESPIVVSWAGSLLDDARFRSGVWRAARRDGLRIAPRSPRESAVAAVGHLAVDLALAARMRKGRGRRALP
ncbi:MAG TPA: BadF/BadG/BcrA/BcrD ATPase family protein [Methylomirabilota bacterium]|nr:BadF/BadG/BcrA/BcrD ATPase family protein [Methylomirabilota bacterium]